MKYVVLLRGVNVGARTIKSADLKSCFEKAGLEDVQTVLATGNVIIESNENPSALKSAIEKLLERTFHFPIRTCLISRDKLAEIIASYPFKNAGTEFHKYVIFADGNFIPAFQLDPKLEAALRGHGVIYWRVLKGRSLDSDFAKQLAKTATKTFSTTRNLNTLEKILSVINTEV